MFSICSFSVINFTKYDLSLLSKLLQRVSEYTSICVLSSDLRGMTVIPQAIQSRVIDKARRMCLTDLVWTIETDYTSISEYIQANGHVFDRVPVFECGSKSKIPRLTGNPARMETKEERKRREKKERTDYRNKLEREKRHSAIAKEIFESSWLTTEPGAGIMFDINDNEHKLLTHVKTLDSADEVAAYAKEFVERYLTQFYGDIKPTFNTSVGGFDVCHDEEITLPPKTLITVKLKVRPRFDEELTELILSRQDLDTGLVVVSSTVKSRKDLTVSLLNTYTETMRIGTGEVVVRLFPRRKYLFTTCADLHLEVNCKQPRNRRL